MGTYGHLQPIEGDYVKWQNVGDNVSGTIARLGSGQDFDGTREVPEIDIALADGSVRTVTCSQTNLYNQIVALDHANQLVVGGAISITFSGMAGNAKLFTIDLGAVTPPVQAPPVVQQPMAQPVVQQPQPVQTPPPVIA